MKPGTRVITEYGPGTVKYREGTLGQLAHRYCVKLDKVPDNLKALHEVYNGIYINDNELKRIDGKPVYGK